MQTAKEKISNMASAAKERITICRAKVEEKAEKASARTHEERAIAKERRKAKEAQAKMELHEAKAAHAAKKLSAKHHHPLTAHNHPPVVDPVAPYGGTHTNQPVGATATMAGTTAPTYPLGGHPPHKYV